MTRSKLWIVRFIEKALLKAGRNLGYDI